MESFDIYLKMIIREKEKEYEASTSSHKSMILFKQIQALNEALDKGPITSTEDVLKTIKRDITQINGRFEAIELFVSDNLIRKSTEGGLSA